jgi:hypothetical protein
MRISQTLDLLDDYVNWLLVKKRLPERSCDEKASEHLQSAITLTDFSTHNSFKTSSSTASHNHTETTTDLVTDCKITSKELFVFIGFKTSIISLIEPFRDLLFRNKDK